jgi:hypothetical protein
VEVVKKKRPEFVLSKFSSDHFQTKDIIGGQKKYLRPNASIIEQRTNVEWKMGAIFTEGNVLRNLSAPHSI